MDDLVTLKPAMFFREIREAGVEDCDLIAKFTKPSYIFAKVKRKFEETVPSRTFRITKIRLQS